MISIICFYWKDGERRRRTGRTVEITREDVRIWDRMVARNVTIPHRRICVTHRPDEIDFMETVPLDMTKHVPGTCFVKLMAHMPGVERLIGERILLMDVDCVITGNIDPLLRRDEPWVGWRNPNYTEGGRRGFYQGSLQLFTAGAMSCLWTDFDARAECGRVPCEPQREYRFVNVNFGGHEQAWISERLNVGYPTMTWRWDRPYFDEADGVYGAGRLVNGRMGNGVQSELPDNARIVFTPGDRAPSQLEFQQRHPWVAKHFW